MRTIKTYTELCEFDNFLDRFEYLKLSSNVGDNTFGSRRYMNQILYKTDRWKQLRNSVMVRDNGCDLGMLDREIITRITVHHINPITFEDILCNSPLVWDPEYLITTSDITHKAIHYSDKNLLMKEPVMRQANDTCPWKK